VEGTRKELMLHSLRTIGKRKELSKRVEAGGSGAVYQEAAGWRRDCCGDDRQYAVFPQGGGAARGTPGDGDPKQFKVISQSVKKTDPNDARNLALYLAKDLAPEVRMKEKTEAQIASVTQTRDTLVKLGTALKNKINNILAAHGISLAKESLSSEKPLAGVLERRFDDMVELELQVIVEQIRGLYRSIGKLEQAIEDRGQKLEGHRTLTSIKGNGNLRATILRSVIGDIDDFSDEGKLAAYLGIVPRVQNSNETERSGRITKRGTKLGRTTLVQCALGNGTVLIWRGITTRSKAGEVGARRSSLWPESSWASFIARGRTTRYSRIFQTSCWRRLEVERTEFFVPRERRAVRYAGRCPAPRQGDTPWPPGPLSLLPQVPERSSPSRVRSAAGRSEDSLR
jgi:transposase IS116/IS110/IS902 family protein